jgi:hypothetical protein
MQTRIQKWGNSLGLRIPRSIAAEAQMREGATVDLSVGERAARGPPMSASQVRAGGSSPQGEAAEPSRRGIHRKTDGSRGLLAHARQFPDLRAGGGMPLYLDEVQTVPGWEGLVRRLIDTGGVEVFVSGSSARLLSREVATGLRGRAMEALIHPFSFREALRHAAAEPLGPLEQLAPVERAALDQRLRAYLAAGGFPEAQGAEPRDRAAWLSSYVDVMVLRDVIERRAVTNPLARRWIERQLLANPGGVSRSRSTTTRCAPRASRWARTPCPATSPISRTPSWCGPWRSRAPRSGSEWSTPGKPIPWIPA